MKQENYVPAVYAEKPTGVSGKYTFIRTVQVIDDLVKLGWHPAVMKGNRHSTVARHLVRFRQAGVVGEEVPEIILINSHDGLCSFQLRAGVFRFACSNGLIIAESLFSAISIRHINYSFAQVKAATAEFAQRLPQIMESVENFKGRNLSLGDRFAFAEEAIKLRWPEETPPINIVRFIAPRRGADEGIDLWKVLNVCQEKLLEGRFYDLKGRRIRRLQNVDRIVKVNQGLFKLALEYAA
ncbi:MAG: DUF932 domain-containing protein [Turneriella sp.]|nr:DUF932 domain-containing protein [Turneriella sp.]